MQFSSTGFLTIVLLAVQGAFTDAANKFGNQFKDELSLDDAVPTIALGKFGKKQYNVGTIYVSNYFQAMQYCHYNGMRLFNIESADETKFLISELKRLLGDVKYNFWTSGTILADNSWVWLETGKPIVYTNWLPNEPNNWNNIEKCLEAIYEYSDTTGDMDMMWNDHDCAGRKYVICESSRANCLAE